MLDGINHIFYHGTVYSPQDAPWPGWLFYASTQYNPDQPVVGRLRGDEPLHRARAVGPSARHARQRPARLLADLRHLGQSRRDGAAARRARCEVAGGHIRRTHGAGAAGARLQFRLHLRRAAGAGPTAVDGQLATPGPATASCWFPPPAACRQRRSRRSCDSPGMVRRWSSSRCRRTFPDTAAWPSVARSSRACCRRSTLRSPPAATRHGSVDGRMLRGSVIDALPLLPVVREPMADAGVGFIRRAHPQGHDYFLANLTAERIDELGDARRRRRLGDAARSAHRAAAGRRRSGGPATGRRCTCSSRPVNR